MSPVFITGGDEIHGPITTWELQNEVIEGMRSRGIHEITRTSVDVICDFCSYPVVRWRYTIRPEIVMVQESGTTRDIHIDQDGLWGACVACHNFIQDRAWDKLAMRSLIMFEQTHPDANIPRSLLALGIEGAHGHFKAHWNGSDPEPESPDEDFLKELGEQ